MAFAQVDRRQSHRLPGDSRSSVPPPDSLRNLPSRRNRQASTVSSTPSVPSIYSSTTYSSTSTALASPIEADESETPFFRDSFAESIVDDPFFQRFHATEQPEGVKSPFDTEFPFERHDQSSPKNPSSQPTPPIVSHESAARPRVSRTMEAINIAVIGAHGVGKSHFIQRAMSTPRVPSSNPSTARITIEGVLYAVTLFELDLEYFDLDPDKQIQWPKQLGGMMMPAVHGVLLLYDVTNKDSIIELPQTLSALVNSLLPTVLVATKCDNPENTRQLNTEAVAARCASCIASFNTSANKPESARMSLSTLLRALISNRQGDDTTDFNFSTRRRAASAAHLETPSDLPSGRPLSQQSKHSRASSDMSLIRNGSGQVTGELRQQSRSPRVEYQGGQGPNFLAEGTEDASGQPMSGPTRGSALRFDQSSSTASFLDVEESDGESMRYSDDIPILQRNDELLFDRPAKRAGVTFDDLVDRLLAQKMSKADENFQEIFLCLYRKFAAPGKLFSAILDRLTRAKEDRTTHYLTKTATQLRIIEVVAKWVSTYPGDFARLVTRRKLEKFIKFLSSEPIYSSAAQQMRRTYETSVVDDDDTGWAVSDEIEESEQSEENTAPAAAKAGTKQTADVSDAMGNLSVDDARAEYERRTSASSSVNTDFGRASHASQFQFHSFEDYEREAATMVPTYHMPLTKFRYHIFMDTIDDDIADEVTRIDWVMFSSIRIRDLVRHVSLPMSEKEKCKSLKNVNRMIDHFNHIAKWVANMILMRDKAKHRAQMLEKFMNIAVKLRQLNNYNGLAAVLAGINGTAIHRLTQTRALVPVEIQKRFARLVLLMGMQKSHFAYRLAWENSPLPRIPFIPLHRRDLVSAEEGSMTFVGPHGDRINWKKFEILGEVILPMMKSQGSPYPNLTKHDQARELILDCLMPTDDEDIFQRSVQVESSTGNMVDAGKKKFPWFAK